MNLREQKEIDRATALVGGKLLDGTGGTAIENAVVVLVGNRIDSVGKADGTSIPPSAEVIDVTGKTVLPGFINCHTHLCLDGSADPVTALAKRSTVENVLVAAQHAPDRQRQHTREQAQAGIAPVGEAFPSGVVRAAHDA